MKITKTEIDGIRAKEEFNKGVERVRTAKRLVSEIEKTYDDNYKYWLGEYLEIDMIDNN